MKARNLLSCAIIMLAAASSATADRGDNSAFIDDAAGKCAAVDDAGNRVTTTDSRILVTHDRINGSVHLRCSFDGYPTVSGKAWVQQSFLCGTYMPDMGILLTYDSHIRQTPNGGMTLSCHF